MGLKAPLSQGCTCGDAGHSAHRWVGGYLTSPSQPVLHHYQQEPLMPSNARRQTQQPTDPDARLKFKPPKPGKPVTIKSRSELQTLQAFRTIFGSARLHDAEVRRTAGVSGSQLWALSEIARFTAISVNALSQRMALHQTTASNLVHALVKRKLIRRMRDGTDQRVVRLHVSAEGRRILENVPGPHAGLLVDALRELDTKKRPATTAAGETLLGE
jgi:DNA-binding MarR family transcriptional regulator